MSGGYKPVRSADLHQKTLKKLKNYTDSGGVDRLSTGGSLPPPPRMGVKISLEERQVRRRQFYKYQNK